MDAKTHEARMQAVEALKTKVTLRGYRETRGKVPMVNVKVHKGVEALTDNQWKDIRADLGLEPLPDGTVFGREWCEDYAESHANNAAEQWHYACREGFEHAEEYARELFKPWVRDTKKLKAHSAGRSGGWLYVEGLPDFELEPWDTTVCNNCDEVLEHRGDFWESTNRMPDDAHICLSATDCRHMPYVMNGGLTAAWLEFEKWCRAEADDTPYRYAWDLGANVFQREHAEAIETARLEGVTRAKDSARDAQKVAFEALWDALSEILENPDFKLDPLERAAGLAAIEQAEQARELEREAGGA